MTDRISKKSLLLDYEQHMSRLRRTGAKKPDIYKIMYSGYGGKLMPDKPLKQHYSMSAGEIAGRAPFSMHYKELPVMMNWKLQLLYGWVVVDKNGDKVFPPSDVGAKSLCHSCVEELNIVAAKWLMENEGSSTYYGVTTEEIKRYRK